MASLAALGACVAAINQDARRFMVDAFHGELPSSFSTVPVHHFARTISDTVPLGSSGLIVLAVSAVVLFLLAFRL